MIDTCHPWPAADVMSVALFSTLAVLAPVSAESFTVSLDDPVPLAGTWKFQPGDDPAWADPAFDDTGWLAVRVPGSWGRQGHSEVDVAWYRLTLRIEAASLVADTVPGLRMKNVSTGYELYAGGELLGTVAGPPPAMAYDRHRTFAIPLRAVAGDGSLVLAVRIWRAEAVGRRSGGIRQAPLLGRLEDVARVALGAEAPSLILAILFLVVGLFHLVLYALRSGERAYLWYSLFVLSTAAYTFLRSQLRFTWSDDFVFLKEAEFLAVFVLPALGIQFVWGLLSLPIGRSLRLYQLSHPALGLLVGLTPGLELNLTVLAWWTYWSLPVVTLAVLLIAQRARQGDPEARIMGVGMAVLVAAYFEGLLAANNLVPLGNLGIYGFLVFVLSMAISLAHRFSRVHRQLDAARGVLERRVESRTRELEEAMVAAEAASRAKSDFLAHMSHEIRTPMNGILGVLALLAKLDLPPSGRGYVKTLRSSAASLLRTVEDILDYSRFEAGKVTLDATDFPLRDTVREVIGSVAPRAAGKGVDLRLDVGAELPARLRGDPARLRQVLLNLVDNAVKFTSEGHVAVRVELVEPGAGRAQVRFSVEDTGIGIDQLDLARLFSPFTQADTSAARSFGGTGLGLAISKKIVEMAGGVIGVESAPGGGSTFTFTWPVATTDGAR